MKQQARAAASFVMAIAVLQSAAPLSIRAQEIPAGIDADAIPFPIPARPTSVPSAGLEAQPGPVDPQQYLMGPGDRLTLEMWGRLVRTTSMEVNPEGRVFLPGRGSIEVSGRTLAWTRDRILSELDRAYRGVSMDVRLSRPRTFKVYVTGEVKKPGAVEVTAVTRASEALARTEPSPEASARNIVLRRRDGSVLRVDLARFETAGRTAGNPMLADGDVVHVPHRTTTLVVSGAVGKPSRYEWAPGDSLLTALDLAGGLLPSAATDRILLVRFHGPTSRDSLWLPMPDVLSGSTNPPVSDGDRVFVYYVADWHDQPAASILGEVERPGSYPFTLGRDRLSDLVRWAGGFRPRANKSAIFLLRQNDAGADGDLEFDRLARLSRGEMTESEYAVFQTKLAERRNSFRVDFDRISTSGPEVDPLLSNGDIVRADPMLLSVRVEGQVRRPGVVDFRDGRAVGDYIELAGGFTNRASRSKIRVARTLTGQVVPASGVRSIQPGDFIWVPEGRDVDPWQIFKDVLAIAGQIAVIVVAARR